MRWLDELLTPIRNAKEQLNDLVRRTTHLARRENTPGSRDA